MSRAFDVIYVGYLFVMIVFLFLIAWGEFSESSWKDKCKDAGGFPASHYVCVNPAAVIEVN